MNAHTDPLRNAAEAERLLGEPLLKQAFSAVEQRLVERLKASAIGDVETHHTIALSLQLLGQVEAQLRNWVKTGEIEAAKVSALESWRKRRFGA